VHLSGFPRLRVKLATRASGVHLIAALYDVDRRLRATMISRGAYLVRHGGDACLAVDLYAQDWRVRAGHRIALLLSGSDDLYFAGGTSFSTVEVRGGTVALPFLRHRRRLGSLAGRPSRTIQTRTTFRVDPGDVSAGMVRAPLPPRLSRHP
jgi:predicted acyl esterase